ncbi:hypothetical protein QJS04_geneDACA017198 [Acorus gramineus]|uniref:Uncharacterized protein n=1 Tax=Acorus gramineus TaxID=55184 RepID=A0AAV9BMD9_ACOGR|nr:hypothetical protein QJS04_geneDACA017198 [Acorus gramineus]
MASGNSVISDKMQFPVVGGGGGGGDIHHQHQQQQQQQRQQWLPDERDGFISWLRSEFAAANAIIDSLVHHLRITGEPGEYEVVMGCVQQRRCNWTPVLHMQQYFPVAEVVFALQQVAWRKQQQRQFEHPKGVVEKDLKRSPSNNYRQVHRVENHGFRNGNPAIHSGGPDAGVERGEEAGKRKGEEVVAATEEKGLGKSVEKEVIGLFYVSIMIGVFSDKNEVHLFTKSGLLHYIYLRGAHSKLSESYIFHIFGVEVVTSGQADCSPKDVEPNETDSGSLEPVATEGCKNAILMGSAETISNQEEKQKGKTVHKTFVSSELIEGKAVNVVEGLKLYNNLFDSSEVSRIVTLVNDMRNAGRRREFQGKLYDPVCILAIVRKQQHGLFDRFSLPSFSSCTENGKINLHNMDIDGYSSLPHQTYVVSKRPNKGHGREMVQLGISITDGPPEDENPAGILKGKFYRKLEPIPILLQDIIDRLLNSQVMSVKPDSCIIDFYNEGDHSHPHAWPSWYGRPVSSLFLTECDMVFGRMIAMDHPGEYKGAIRVSLAPGYAFHIGIGTSN